MAVGGANLGVFHDEISDICYLLVFQISLAVVHAGIIVS